jgi:hypothetical protein
LGVTGQLTDMQRIKSPGFVRILPSQATQWQGFHA